LIFGRYERTFVSHEGYERAEMWFRTTMISDKNENLLESSQEID
jgi:hypothetical protein